MNNFNKPLITIKLDAYTKTNIKNIQTIATGAGIVATLSSIADIMTLIKQKPTKTIKKIYKKDWNDFILRIKGMNSVARKRIIQIAFMAERRYMGMPGANNEKLYFFWKGVLDAFSK